MLTCPICHTPLTLHGKTYTCHNRHSYDVSKDGYINLHVIQHKNSHTAGDTNISVQARRRFLAGGFYEPLRDKAQQVIDELAPTSVLDIGCGEGNLFIKQINGARQSKNWTGFTQALKLVQIAVLLWQKKT